MGTSEWLFGTYTIGYSMKGAVVLAGGYSTRFGDADKAVADVAGEPMIRRIVSTVAPVVDEVVVNAREEQRSVIDGALVDTGFSYRFAFDAVADRGPLSGMVRGFEAAAADYTLVVACDMPFVEQGFVETLFDRAAGADAAVPIEQCGDEQWLQPLQAVYDTERTLSVARRALEEGITSPATAIGRLDIETISVADASAADDRWTLKNVNSPHDLREAERYFSGTPVTDV
ncbi:molybdenum cofactor guanylyltransferase [Halanaeroarchaeum sp. HSR-CO]|uniref:molybdenum cofactor guanylyltransferase n=1 Tax=Halanaeroarchaeum sp. HSR-CO TaxID=2866382 RepID=UPI00217EEA7B|nr:molybdenum cofactor guanylyltransferase [Halanaeroarchaeum sp. HSR-CO]